MIIFLVNEVFEKKKNDSAGNIIIFAERKCTISDPKAPLSSDRRSKFSDFIGATIRTTQLKYSRNSKIAISLALAPLSNMKLLIFFFSSKINK